MYTGSGMQKHLEASPMQYIDESFQGHPFQQTALAYF